MISNFELRNFKCFKHLVLRLGSLNIFSGLNGMGKSTVIQAYLLLRQSFLQHLLPYKVGLNGEYINLGTGKDVLFENADKEIINISINENNNAYTYIIEYNSISDTLSIVEPQELAPSICTDKFEYLNAERYSPQTIYPKSSYYVDYLNQLGINGQFAIHYLLNHEDEQANIKIPGSVDEENSIKNVVQYWLNEICPGIKIDVNDIAHTDLAKIGYYFTEGQRSNIVRPTNIGFGISYVLPVILSLAKAQQGSILIIENPEAHLHPQGQRKMGELISMCAANNVQIFIETHSDHVLNGIRIGVKECLIDCNEVKLFYFDKELRENVSTHFVECPTIDNKGKLNYWPNGFFDEWEKALDKIL